MKHSDRNKDVIDNFILWLTHESEQDSMKEGDRATLHITAEQLYKSSKLYIEEDHVDGKGNEQDDVVEFYAESSYVTEDKAMDHKEEVVVFADFGEDLGTKTVCYIGGMGNIGAVQDLMKFIKSPEY